MSKLSISFNDSGFKGFIAHHIEKIALGTAVLILAILFATGYTSPTVKEKQNPAELAKLAEAARAHINQDSWDILKDERATDTKHVSRVESARTRISSVNYSAPSPLLSPTMPEIVKRGDPELLPPRLPEVSPLYGVYARVKTTRDTNYRDPLWDSKQAIDMPEAPIRRPTRPSRTRRGRDDEEEFSEEIEDIEIAEQPTAKTIPSNYARRLGIAGDQYSGDIESRGAVSSGSASGVLEGFYGVVFKALVPIEAQTLEYLDTFENAEGYSPSRDLPRYVDMQIFRADVTDLPADAEVPEDAWKPLTNSRYAAQYAQLWGKGLASNGSGGDFEGSIGSADGGEMVDARYLDPIMTFPLPAMLLKPEGDEMLHSETPLASALEEDGDAASEGLLEIDDLPPIGEGLTDIGEIGAPTRLNPEDELYNTEGEYGESLEPVPYRLIRYTDTTVKPGRKYRYRTRVFLKDPNSLVNVGNTQDSYTAADGGLGEYDGSNDGGASGLNESMLEEEVLLRLKAREAEAAKTGKPSIYVSSPWSEPSPVVSVPARPEKVLAGSVEAPTKVVSGDYRFERGEPTAKLAAVIWSKKRTVDMPAEKEVMRGSFLNFRAQTDVIHPQLLMVRRLPDEHFDLDSMVLDIRGGERLPRSSSGSDPLTAPGELLLVDRDGNLIVRSEIEDAEQFRDYLLMEAVPPPPEVPEDTYEEEMEEERGRFRRGFDDT